MLASLFNKSISSSPIELPSLYSVSPLSLSNTESDIIVHQKLNNFPLYGTNEVLHFAFDKNDFRILVLEDTGNILSNDRYYVLYDSEIEKNKFLDDRKNSSLSRAQQQRFHENLYDTKEIKLIAQYLFGSSFQGELKQTSRIHSEPEDLRKSLKNKTLVVRTYHFDANFEDTLLASKKKPQAPTPSPSTSPIIKTNVPVPEFRTDIFDDTKSSPGSGASSYSRLQKLQYCGNSPVDDAVDNEKAHGWTAEPATKIDHDFSSKNNTPIGICIVLPFSSEELTQTIGANYQEFDKWLYEIQDLTLKYLKKYYALQVEGNMKETTKAGLASSIIPKSFFGTQLSKYQKEPSESSLDAGSIKTRNKKSNSKSKFRFFKVDNAQRNKIHFNRLLLQTNFETEKVFLNYFHRINIFLNTPRIITGITSLEKLLKINLLASNTNTTSSNSSPKTSNKKPKNILFLQFCKEIRHWLTIHDSMYSAKSGAKFLPTLLALLYPLRQHLIESKPANKKTKIVRVVFAAQNDVVINSLLSILSNFLPDVIFKYDILSESEYNGLKDTLIKEESSTLTKPNLNSKSSVHQLSTTASNNSQYDDTHTVNSAPPPTDLKSGIPEEAVDTSSDSIEIRPLGKKNLPPLDLSKTESRISEAASEYSRSDSRSSSRPHTPYLLHNFAPPSPIISKNRGLALSSPKSIPITQTSTYDSFSAYSSQSESSSYKSLNDFENFSYFVRSGSISSNNNNCFPSNPRSGLNSSRSSSFVQHNEDETRLPKFFSGSSNEPTRRRLQKTLSVTDLTQKSIRASNSSASKAKLFSKKIDLIKRTPTAILKINFQKYSCLNNLKSTDNGNLKPSYSRANSSDGVSVQSFQTNDQEEGFSTILDISKPRRNGKEDKLNRMVLLENSKSMKNYIHDIMVKQNIDSRYDSHTSVLNVSFDTKSLLRDEYDDAYVYNQTDVANDAAGNYESELSKKYLNNDALYGRITVPGSEIDLPPLVGISMDFIPEFTIQAVKKSENIKQLIVTAMKHDLFHNEYIDKCVSGSNVSQNELDLDFGTDKKSITKTIFVNLATREINEFEIVLKQNSQDKPGKYDTSLATHKHSEPIISSSSLASSGITTPEQEINSYNSVINIPKLNMSIGNQGSGSHVRHSSIFSMSSLSSSSPGSSSHYSQSSSPIKASPSILNLFDFSNNYLTNNNPFTFQGKDFVLMGNKVFDEQGKLCAKDLQSLIQEMETILNVFANVHDDADV